MSAVVEVLILVLRSVGSIGRAAARVEDTLVHAPIHDDDVLDFLYQPEDRYGKPFQLCCCREDDDMVPPPCLAEKCPLSHDHERLNGPWMQNNVGKWGFNIFSRYRKLWLGLASYVSIIAFFVTIYGCMALSNNNSIVRRTYWTGVTGNNYTAMGDEQYSMYVGLTTFIYTNCTFTPGWEIYPDYCEETKISFTSQACRDGDLGDACDACADVAISTWLAAVTNIIGLVLAINGCQVRMKRIADVPVQKALGMITDAIGCLALTYSLYDFRYRCMANLNDSLQHAPGTTVERLWTGPGLLCYAFCALTGAIRAVIHCVTPCPDAAWHREARLKLAQLDEDEHPAREGMSE
ncbi:hypothetical protein B484DRAFT_476958 [Ochromonadaceae sp. CCMP2298]|nr:hypothetical protein B484DRAFT_476958 [Ochromonadaceae sp. CCMP2298]